MGGLLSDVANKAEDVLAGFFKPAGLHVETAGVYAQALVGMVVRVGAWWADEQALPKEVVADHLTALAYGGLSRLPRDPSRHVRYRDIPAPTTSS